MTNEFVPPVEVRDLVAWLNNHGFTLNYMEALADDQPTDERPSDDDNDDDDDVEFPYMILDFDQTLEGGREAERLMELIQRSNPDAFSSPEQLSLVYEPLVELSTIRLTGLCSADVPACLGAWLRAYGETAS